MKLMESLFFRMTINKYKNSKNILKKIHFYISVFLLKRDMRKTVESYGFYSLLIEYIELVQRLKHLVYDESMTTRMSSNTRSLSIMNNGNKINVTVHLTNRCAECCYISNYALHNESMYWFSLDDLRHNPQGDILKDKVKQIIRQHIIKSISKLIDEVCRS